MKVKFIHEQIWKQAIERGVKFRFIINKSLQKEKPPLNLDPIFEKNNFVIRWIQTRPPVSLLLIDDQEAFCRIGFNVENPVLWSRSPHFVAMMKDYFETKWEATSKSQEQDRVSPQLLAFQTHAAKTVIQGRTNPFGKATMEKVGRFNHIKGTQPNT